MIDVLGKNSLSKYYSVRYALSCLSYTSPTQSIQYKNRLNIVRLLLDRYPLDLSLNQAILGKNLEHVHLFPLFDFLFYALIEHRIDLEEFAWQMFIELPRTKDFLDHLQIILQNAFISNHYFSHVIYLNQRVHIVNCFSFVIAYLDRISFDSQPNRFHLLLYLIYVDQGLTVLEKLAACFHLSLNPSRRHHLVKFLEQCRGNAEYLKFYCRRTIRQRLAFGIHCHLKFVNLPAHLKAYILLDELHFLTF